MVRLIAFPLISLVVAINPAWGQDRPTKVRNDKARVEADGFWIYNDLPRGIAEAKRSGKPLLVVFRCIPCEACAQLDEQVVERDPAVQDLLARYVCVRIVHANGMDLSLFQFDYDQSWAAFLLNADLTIYGRYGTRSHQTESDDDVSLKGFAKALQAGLELHKEYPGNRKSLEAKHGPPSEIPVPEQLPSLRGKYASRIDYEGKVVQSCIHCHQVGDGLRQMHRSDDGGIPDKILYPYPNPKVLGLILDPEEKAKVKAVLGNSTAEADGVRVGDEIKVLDGQPILSIADLQWVLHNAAESGTLPAEIIRGGESIPIRLTLAKGWRRSDTISWRATSWELRRMVTGGLVLEELSDADRRKLDLPDSTLALRITHVGQYGAHAAGKQAGFKQGDVFVAVDGRNERLTESGLLARLINAKRIGDKVPVTVLRGGERVNLTLPIQ
jgi:hypothetical protein